MCDGPIDIGDRRFLNAMPSSASFSLSPPACFDVVHLCVYVSIHCVTAVNYESMIRNGPYDPDLSILRLYQFKFSPIASLSQVQMDL